MSKPARPQQVTSACLFLGLSSALLLFFVIGWLSSWNSLAIQEGLTEALADLDLGAAGLSVQGTIDGLRTALMVATVPLVAGAVFAVYAARGHEQSRTLLSVVAVLNAVVFVATGGIIGLIPAAFAVAAIVQLRSPDARRWYAEVNGREVPPELVRSAAAPAGGASTSAARPDPFAPGAVPTGTAPTDTAPTGTAQSGPPSPVRTATLITMLSTGLAAVLSAAFLAVYAVAGDSLADAMLEAQADSPFSSMMESSATDITAGLRTVAVMCAIALALGLVALVASIRLARGHRDGHVALTVASAGTIGLGLFTLVGLPWAGMAVWVLVLLRRPESRAWVR
ncbi:hypothetical protein [Aeromicrobium sp. CF3.5]|uniref:hypothetical protein n=1 Tax=Aeromicrobium sp. CF3.5 TaxID=3373078 RepID=UPI003EE5C7AA